MKTKSNQGGFKEFLKSRDLNLFLFFLGLVTILLSRAYYLQVVKASFYKEMADRQHQGDKELLPKRGRIFLQNKGGELYPVAVNRDYFTAFVSPKEVDDNKLDEVADQLAETFKIDKQKVLQSLNKRQDEYEILKYKVSDEEKNKIVKKNIKGLYFELEKGKSFRFYPSGSLASQVIGYVGINGERDENGYFGRYGIERYFDRELSGKPGELSQKQNAQGGWLPFKDRNLVPKEDGVDIVLTIEYSVQHEVERILKEAVEEYKADSGSIAVMDPKTGRILAMANYPTFDPNNYSKVEDLSYLTNPVISRPYESGSVFKAITVAIGLDDNKINPDTIYTDEGFIETKDYTIWNAEKRVYGLQTMAQVLEKSLNTGVVYIEKLTGNKVFREYVERFGFSQKTGIELPAESSGKIDNLKNLKSEIEFYTAAYGQGITVTPLQLLVSYSALANGGNLMQPQIIDRKIYPDGKVETYESKIIHRVISEETSKKIGEMLRSVVVNGHGKRADVPGYLVGGKTGTAQVADPNGGYMEDYTIGTFMGYAPINDPKFVVIVKIDNPRAVQWAESSAAPTFGKVMKFLLDFYEVDPTEEVIYDNNNTPNLNTHD